MATSQLINGVTLDITFYLYSGNIISAVYKAGICSLCNPEDAGPESDAHLLVYSTDTKVHYVQQLTGDLDAGAALLHSDESADVTLLADPLTCNIGNDIPGASPPEIQVLFDEGAHTNGFNWVVPADDTVPVINLLAYYGYVDNGILVNGDTLDITLEADSGILSSGSNLYATEVINITLEDIQGANCTCGNSLHGLQYTIFFEYQCGEVTTSYPEGYYFGIKPFEGNNTIVPELEVLKATNDYGVTNRTMLLALGDYWGDYFTDIDTLASISTGAEILFSDVYDQLLEMVLSSSIKNIPEIDKVKYSMVLFKENEFSTAYNESGGVGYYYIDTTNIESLEYLVSSLFAPEVILRRGREFDIIDGQIRFYVDLFDDVEITDHVYTLGVETDRSIIMWATNTAFTTSLIYERFGRFVYIDEPDSTTYKAIVTKMLEYYVSNKNVTNIERILNALDGLPYTRSNDERIVSIQEVTDAGTPPMSILETATQYAITTQFRTYLAPIGATLLVEVDQVVPMNTLLAMVHKVDDYITNPNWMDGAMFPMELVSGYKEPYYHIRARSNGTELEMRLYDLMYNVLKYNIIYIFTSIDTNTYRGCGPKTCTVLPFIQDALPVYLYPLLDSTVL